MDEKALNVLLQTLTPAPVRTRGQVRAVDVAGRFQMVLADATELVAFADELFPIKQLGSYLGQEVEIHGTGFADHRGQLAFVIASGFAPVVGSVPANRLPGSSPAVRADMAAKLRGIIGKWPGAASDEEETAANAQEGN